MPVFNSYIHTVAANRRPLQTALFLLALISLLLNLKYHILLHQTGRNPILLQDVDPTYWGVMLLGLPDLFGSSLALVLDITLFASCIASLVWNRQQWAPLVFFVCHFLYFMLFNMIAGHHYINIGLLFMSFPFVFYNNERFAAAFSFTRLLFCFMLVAAGLWKVFRGNLTYPDQGYLLLLQTHMESLFRQDSSFYFQVIRFFLAHKFLTHLLWSGMIVLELLFVLGFITVKRDGLLLVAYLLFAVGGYFFYYIYAYENLLFLLTLMPVIRLIETITHKAESRRQAAGPNRQQPAVL